MFETFYANRRLDFFFADAEYGREKKLIQYFDHYIADLTEQNIQSSFNKCPSCFRNFPNKQVSDISNLAAEITLTTLYMYCHVVNFSLSCCKFCIYTHPVNSKFTIT